MVGLPFGLDYSDGTARRSGRVPLTGVMGRSANRAVVSSADVSASSAGGTVRGRRGRRGAELAGARAAPSAWQQSGAAHHSH
ncbi:hypothetical protein ABTZ98_33090, partial [Streptomyces bacillaris]